MKKALVYSVSLVLLSAAATFVFLSINSPRSTAQFLGRDGQSLPNSIAEIRDVEINGARQRLLIRGADKNNPVLLHLHGGPGGPDQSLLQSYGKTLEDLFTVVYWDQRGSGASFQSAQVDQPLILEQLVDDGVAISNLLRREFKQDKIYLQGHSWGTLLGVKIITKAPELYTAFFAVGLFGYSQRAERLSWHYALKAAQDAGDTRTAKRLTEMGPPPYKTNSAWIKNVTEQRKLLWPYENPNAPALFAMTDIYWMFANYHGYSLKEKLSAFDALDYTMQQLWPVVVNTNLIETHTEIDVPFYVFQGKYDQHTVTEVAKDYFEAINAPDKAYHLFENSAHWPHVREYEKYRALLEGYRDKLQTH